MNEKQTRDTNASASAYKPINGLPTIFVLKADATNWINYMKPLLLAEELGMPYALAPVDTTSDSYRAVHPERYVPALADMDASSAAPTKPFFVFESTACLEYLAARYDSAGDWAGRDWAERATVASWTAYQTAGLGATAKYWLYFLSGFPSRSAPEPQVRVCDKLRENVLFQWRLLEERLADPKQSFVALPDRPTIADISFFPFCMAWMRKLFSVEERTFPSLEAWEARMMQRPAVRKVFEMAPRIGHQ